MDLVDTTSRVSFVQYLAGIELEVEEEEVGRRRSSRRRNTLTLQTGTTLLLCFY